MTPDQQALIFDFAKNGTLLVGLVIAVKYLVGELKILADKREAERAAERKKCEETVEELSKKLGFFEERDHKESMEREARFLDCINRQTTAFEKVSSKLQ